MSQTRILIKFYRNLAVGALDVFYAVSRIPDDAERDVFPFGNRALVADASDVYATAESTAANVCDVLWY